MKEVTLEIPITAHSNAYSYFKALDKLEMVEMLEITRAGMTFLCTGTDSQIKHFSEITSSQDKKMFKADILNKDHNGNVTLLVQILWLGMHNEFYEDHREDVEFFKRMEKVSIYTIGKPAFEKGVLRTTLIGSEITINQLLDGLKGLYATFKIISMGSPKGKRKSILDTLTPRQKEIIDLAYRLGYYQVPRKIRTEDLAKIFGLDKGTLGEHLRRAEKHILDEIMSR